MKTLAHVLILISMFSSFVAFAVESNLMPPYYSRSTITEMSRLQEAALSSDYAYEKTRYLTNNIGPRLSGTVQAQRAVEYVASEMRKLGLDVRLQEVMVPHWIRGEETGEIVAFSGMMPGITQKIVLTALGGSVATPPEGIAAEIIAVRTFEELAALGRDKVAGKIVLFYNKFDQDMQASGFGASAYAQAVKFRYAGAVAASRLGAIGTLVRSAGSSQSRLAHTGLVGYASDVEKIPAAAVSYEDAETLSYLAITGKVRVHLTLTPQTLPVVKSFNVIADLKGSEKPDEIVLVGGHLDSWDLGTGALDDACGVAVSMQVGNLVKQLKMRPKRTIRIVAFMSEENGGAGGRSYFEENKNNLHNHFAAIESDLGASHSVGLFFSGKPEAIPFLTPISQILQVQGAQQIHYNLGELGSDIELLTKGGVPSFSPKVDERTYFRYHHTAADTFDKINAKELAELASVMTVSAYGLANLEHPLPR